MYILDKYISPIESEIGVEILRTGTMIELVVGGVFQGHEIPAGENFIVLGQNEKRETLVARIDPDMNTMADTMPCFIVLPENTRVRIILLTDTGFERK